MLGFAIIGRSILNAAKRMDTSMTKLTPADREHLAFLSRRVDLLEGEYFRLDMHHNVERDLWSARREFKEFVTKLAKDGKDIFDGVL